MQTEIFTEFAVNAVNKSNTLKNHNLNNERKEPLTELKGVIS